MTKTLARVARKIRKIANSLHRKEYDQADALYALADALERQAKSGPTWEERVKAAAERLGEIDDNLPTGDYEYFAREMTRAAFPELAPAE